MSGSSRRKALLAYERDPMMVCVKKILHNGHICC